MCRFLSLLLLVELYPLEFHPGPRLRSAEAGKRLGIPGSNPLYSLQSL